MLVSNTIPGLGALLCWCQIRLRGVGAPCAGVKCDYYNYLSVDWNFLGWKVRWLNVHGVERTGLILLGWIVCGLKWYWDETYRGEMYVGANVPGLNVDGVKCPGVKLPWVNCLGGEILWGELIRGSMCWSEMYRGWFSRVDMSVGWFVHRLICLFLKCPKVKMYLQKLPMGPNVPVLKGFNVHGVECTRIKSPGVICLWAELTKGWNVPWTNVQEITIPGLIVHGVQGTGVNCPGVICHWGEIPLGELFRDWMSVGRDVPGSKVLRW